MLIGYCSGYFAMESMKSLNKSLPKSPQSRSAQPPEHLLQAFKSAALSVTNLYKTAATDQAQARVLGYRDALDSLLAFLDKENLGIGDGEGWKVRRWATERLDGSPPAHSSSDSDEDHVETTKRPRSTSPTISSTLQRKPSQETLEIRQQSRSSSPTYVISTTSIEPLSSNSLSNNDMARPTEIFSFTSPYPYPNDAEMQTDSSCNGTAQPELSTQANTTVAPSVRVELMPKGSRAPHRNGNHSSRHNTRSATAVRALGPGAGSKRRIAFNDYFDLGSLGDSRDSFGGGGGKRGKFI